MAQVARRRETGTELRKTTQRSHGTGDQLQKSQSTHALLSELFREILPKTKRWNGRSSKGGGGEERETEGGGGKMLSAEVRHHLEARITCFN